MTPASNDSTGPNGTAATATTAEEAARLAAKAAAQRRWLIRAAKLAVVLLVVWFVRETVLAALTQLDEHQWSVRLPWLVLAAVLYFLGTMPCALFWYRILTVLGQQPRLGETVRAYTIGHLGKYVPGKALVVVLRTGLLQSDRVEAKVAAFSVFLETLTMMAVGGFLSAVIILVQFPEQRYLVPLAVGLMAASGTPTLPPVFRWIVRRLPGKAALAMAVPLEKVTFRLMAYGWLGVGAGWFLIGGSLWATLHALGAESISVEADLPLLTAAAALAMVAGFLSLIPGGAGIREIVLMQLLAPRFGAAPALVAAILLRLVWLVAELITSGILYYAFRRDPRV